MQIFIMRHGEAALQAASDPLRELTDNGRQQSRQMAAWLLTQHIHFQQILVSPYRRAIQTLEAMQDIMANQTAASATVWRQHQIQPSLCPGGDASQVSDDLRLLAAEGIDSLLIISHLPLVGYLLAALCPSQTPIMFATSAVSCITLEDHRHGRLNWYITPRELPVLHR